MLALATLPKRQKIAAVEFQAAQYKAVEATFRLAAETRRAYFRAVAARQTVNFLTRARTSADAAADLTRRLGETGAATKLDQARASAFYAVPGMPVGSPGMEVKGMAPETYTVRAFKTDGSSFEFMKFTGDSPAD